MVLESQESKVRYQGNDLATEWPVPFPVLREEHLHLIVTDANGKDTSINSNYEIKGIKEENVSVTYPVEGEPLASGHRLTIYREVPLVQQLDLENGGNFNAEVIERQFDNTVMQIQQIQEQIDRSIKVSISSEEIPKTAEDIYEQVNLITDRAKEAVTQAETAVNSAKEQAEIATSASETAYSSTCTAKAWAAFPYGEPVEFDLGTDEPLFSARHYRDEASEIAMGNLPNASPDEKGLVGITENGKPGWVYQVSEDGMRYEFAPTSLATASVNKVGGVSPDGISIGINSVGEISVLPKSTYTELLTSSGTWTAPKTGFYFIECVGGGGGSGGHRNPSGSGFTAGGGGGGYITAIKKYTKDDIINYIIGAGGLRGTATPTTSVNGTSGGSTSFDGIIAGGGLASTSQTYDTGSFTGIYFGQSSGAVKGGTAGGNCSIQSFYKTTNRIYTVYSGEGGSTPFGVGGQNGVANTEATALGVAGADGTGYGSGAGGCVAHLSNNGIPGGNGRAGCVNITYLGEF